MLRSRPPRPLSPLLLSPLQPQSPPPQSLLLLLNLLLPLLSLRRQAMIPLLRPTKADRPRPPRDEDIVAVARVAAPHGVRGWVRIMVVGLEPVQLISCASWYRQDESDSPWQLHAPIERKTAHRSVLARYEGCEDPEQAAALRHSLVGLRRGDLPPLAAGQHYWCDLVGLQVLDEEGQTLGTVAGLCESQDSELLEVAAAASAKPLLIPMDERYVIAVDLDAGVIRTRWRIDY